MAGSRKLARSYIIDKRKVDFLSLFLKKIENFLKKYSREKAVKTKNFSFK